VAERLAIERRASGRRSSRGQDLVGLRGGSADDEERGGRETARRGASDHGGLQTEGEPSRRGGTRGRNGRWWVSAQTEVPGTSRSQFCPRPVRSGQARTNWPD